MTRYRCRSRVEVRMETVERAEPGRSPANAPQAFYTESTYDLAATGDGEADAAVLLIEEVVEGTPRVIDLNGAAEENPVYEATTLDTVKTVCVWNMPQLADEATAGNDLEVVFGVDAAAAFLRCTVAASLTFTLKPGESLYFDHPEGVSLAAGTPTVTVKRPTGSTAGTKGRVCFFAQGVSP